MKRKTPASAPGRRNRARIPTARTTGLNGADLSPPDKSDRALNLLLSRIKATDDPDQLRELSDPSERMIFHKQFGNA